ncbi:hypothetical protein [Cecembia calidifontis]|uniref:Uncharacterized protein n=1 Tax=Cecembia calidifontis TaxID=1187080 RepID=A0A4V2F656_9BACT|nr:hypothetical protein [Cecembia calidifontis]RZS95149.1 hypothetical protein BC751_0665 [Cecembia calidifontis]
MIRYLQLSLADLGANIKEILYKVGLSGNFLKAFCAFHIPEIQAKIFFLDGIHSGNSLQNLNHLKPAMVLNKSNRL